MRSEEEHDPMYPQAGYDLNQQTDPLEDCLGSDTYFTQLWDANSICLKCDFKDECVRRLLKRILKPKALNDKGEK